MTATGDTITDAQCREVMAAAERDIDAEESWWRDNHQQAWSANAQRTHAQRLAAAREAIMMATTALNPKSDSERRGFARRWIAAAYNARKGA